MERRIAGGMTVVVMGIVMACTLFAQGAQRGGGPAPAGGEGARAGAAGGQGAPAVKPPLFFREEWKQPPYTGQLNDPARRLNQAAVTSANLELKVYGPCNTSTLGVEVYGTPKDSVFPMNLWTGMCEAPVAVTLRDRNNFVDLSGAAKIKWLYRAANLHAVRPVVRLASGQMLVGNHADATPAVGQIEPDMVESEFSLAPLRWYVLDPEKVVIVRPGSVDNPDLSRVDEVGFVDLMPGGGHSNAGWINVGPFEVYGKPVKR